MSASRGGGGASGPAGAVRHGIHPLDEADLRRFYQGIHHRLHEKLGAHPGAMEGESGVAFGVWAPNADAVAVMGSFNGWDNASHALCRCGETGIWAGFIAGIGQGTPYKYHVVAGGGALRADKADPFGVLHEVPPATASVVWDLDYEWGDGTWMEERRRG